MMKKLINGAALSLLTAGALHAQGQYPSVTVQDGFPVLGACTTNEPYPQFAQAWQAKTLLTPFDDGQLHFAQVAVNSHIGAMRVTVKGVSNGVVEDIFFTNDKNGGVTEYRIAEADGNLTCTKVGTIPKWTVPQPDALSNANCACQGENPVLGVNAQAWACENGQQLSNGADEYDWYWTAPNGDPVRFLFSRDNNAIGLPILGQSAMTHFTSYDDSLPADFITALNVCTSGGVLAGTTPDPSIEGVTGVEPANFSPPIWPEKVYSNGALTAVDGSFTEMSIYYDYTNLQEVSRIKYPRAWAPMGVPAGFINDTRLTKGETLEIVEFPNKPAFCGSILQNVGIWHPDWAVRDQCGFRAQIAAGSPLNPQDVDINAMSCFFAGTSRIDAWYDVAGAPHMFYESNAGDLDLIDYYAFEERTAFAPGRFDHPSCAKVPPKNIQNLGTTCTTCHGSMD